MPPITWGTTLEPAETAGKALYRFGRQHAEDRARFGELLQAEDELAAGFYELGRSFRILKILTIIYLVLTVGYLVFLFLMGGLGILAGLMES